MNDTIPEDLQIEMITKMDVEYLVRFALGQNEPGVPITMAVINRAAELGIQLRTVDRIKHQIRDMEENTGALPWNA